jgi:hypothetical protein
MDDQGTNREGSGHVGIFWAMITLSGLPLLAYPFVLFANMMSLLAEGSMAEVPIAARITWYTFLVGSTLYPVVFFVCGAKGWDHAHWGGIKGTIFWSLAPLLYLLVIRGVFSSIESMHGQ